MTWHYLYSECGKVLPFLVNDAKCYIELKTPNTSWRVSGVEVKTKPITDNIRDVIADIHKLRQNCPAQTQAICAFILFPVPLRIWKNEQHKLLLHLHRIEIECDLIKDSLITGAEFIPLKPEFGVAIFVVKVV